MPLQDLIEDGLYVALYLRSDPPEKDNFHWALYLHDSQGKGGTRYHIRNLSSGWIPAHEYTSDVLTSFVLVGIVQIGEVAKAKRNAVDTTIRSFDCDLNRPETTCKIWLLKVLGVLWGEETQGLVISSLEREVKDWGNLHAHSAAGNVQPRPISALSVSRLID